MNFSSFRKRNLLRNHYFFHTCLYYLVNYQSIFNNKIHCHISIRYKVYIPVFFSVSKTSRGTHLRSKLNNHWFIIDDSPSNRCDHCTLLNVELYFVEWRKISHVQITFTEQLLCGRGTTCFAYIILIQPSQQTGGVDSTITLGSIEYWDLELPDITQLMNHRAVICS